MEHWRSLRETVNSWTNSVGEKNVKYKYKLQEYAYTNTNTEIQIHNYKVHNFKYTNTVAAVLRLQVGETVNSWTNSAGEKNVWQIAS